MCAGHTVLTFNQHCRLIMVWIFESSEVSSFLKIEICQVPNSDKKKFESSNFGLVGERGVICKLFQISPLLLFSLIETKMI